VTAAAAVAPRGLARVRPRLRRGEAVLLLLVYTVLVVGGLSLGMTRTGEATVAGWPLLVTYGLALAIVHLAQTLAGRRTDQVLLPAVGMLGGLGLLVMIRLPQDLVTQDLGSLELGLAELQTLWLCIGLAIAGFLAVAVRSDAWLRMYKYTWALAGLSLLVLTFVFGVDQGGARLTLVIGPFSGQPSELLKVILVVFLAGYLAEYRPILATERTSLGPIRLPPLPYLAPMLAMVALGMGVVIVQRDLGAALLFYVVFLAMLYIATGRASWAGLGLALGAVAAIALYLAFPHVRERVAVWLDPFADPLGSGFQIVQALHAFARGGLFGVGLGAGLPEIAGRLPVPAVHTDFPLAAIGEEMGLAMVLGVLGLYLVVLERGLRVAAAAADPFRALLAAGLALVIGVQALVIAAGDLRIIPLTGITLPFVSYGGSSILANSLVVGLLLALSDRGIEAPAPPRTRGPIMRAIRRGGA
jgi:cell division protein FtsW (lipid II flippase)